MLDLMEENLSKILRNRLITFYDLMWLHLWLEASINF